MADVTRRDFLRAAVAAPAGLAALSAFVADPDPIAEPWNVNVEGRKDGATWHRALLYFDGPAVPREAGVRLEDGTYIAGVELRPGHFAVPLPARFSGTMRTEWVL